MTKPRNIAGCLEGSNDNLQKALQRAKQLNRLNKAIKTLLPVELGEHCRVANLRSHTLIIQVDNNAWATRLRYHTPQLLKAVHAQLALNQITDIRINIKPVAREIVRQGRQIHLSRHSAEVIENTAQTTSDPQLRAALLRLAKNASRK